MFSFVFLLSLGLFVCLVQATSQLEDLNENCAFWAGAGECAKNPSYMLQNCKLSCVNAHEYVDDTPIADSFYDIVEKDSLGAEILFEQFRGKVVYVVNVASKCGYTEENYAIFRDLNKYRDQGFEMVIAPCNGFGAQEPGDGRAIRSFAKKNNYEGIILSKDEVNGPSTRPLFKYLKSVADKPYITWNFDGKFLIDKNGNAHIPGDDIEADVQRLLKE